MAGFTRVRTVDDRGVSLLAVGDRPVDVCLDGRRVWTFWTLRDTESVAGPAIQPSDSARAKNHRPIGQ